MTHDTEHRKNWRENWLLSLLQLSDLDLQQRWIDKRIRNPAWSYIEFRCGYFDDLVLDAGYETYIDRGFVTRAEYECIKDFHTALIAYKPPGDPHDAAGILNDANWQQVVALGQESTRGLEALITDSAEKNLFAKKSYASPLTAGDFTWPKKPNWFQKLLTAYLN